MLRFSNRITLRAIPAGTQRAQCLPHLRKPGRSLFTSAASRSRGLSLLTSVVVGSGVILTMLSARKYYKTLLHQTEGMTRVHRDSSLAHIKVERQVQPKKTITFLLQKNDGVIHPVTIELDKVSHFIRKQILALEESRQDLIKNSSLTVNENLSCVFNDYRVRCPRFANWYFSYPTMYKLLSTALSSALRNTLTFSTSNQTLAETVSLDLMKYLQQKFEYIVLRPEITDAQLRRAYANSYKETHESFLGIIVNTETKFQDFIAKETTHIDEAREDDVGLCLDWEAQLHKINIAISTHEKKPEGVAITGALAMGGAMMGKSIVTATAMTTKGVAGATAGKLGGAAMAGKGLTGMLFKFASPFVAKVASVGPVIGSGAVGGSVVAGPIGGVIGATVGITVDFIINKGIELAQKDEFLADTYEALDAMQVEWQIQLENELHRVINVWVDDIVQLLLSYIETNRIDETMPPLLIGVNIS